MLGLLLLVWGLGGDVEAIPRMRRSCTILWDAVTTYVSGEAATTLNGYRVYTSATSGVYGAYTLQVAANVTQAACRTLGLVTHNQTYYVVVTALDESGAESAASNELAVTITAGVVLVR